MIAHADDAGMLRRCVQHHLRIGVENVFVSLNLDDEPSRRVAEELASQNVRFARVQDFAHDALDYFTAAKELVTGWTDPEWLIFLDSDEFWIPKHGDIHDTAMLSETDAFSVRRFNAPPLRGADGKIGEIRAADPSVLVVGARQDMDAAFLAAHPDAPWINARIAPKLCARANVVATVGLGAHDFEPRLPDYRRAIPDDLLIVHVPFTTEERFRRKVRSIRAMLATHGHRFQAGQGWHWRRWLTIEDAGTLSDEFEAQVLDERAVAELVSSGVLVTPSELFENHHLSRE